MIKVKKKYECISKSELKKFEAKDFNLLADLVLVSYTSKNLQKYIKEKNVDIEKFRPITEKLFPFDLTDEIYYAYEDINKLGWNYFTYSSDEKSGFESVTYVKDDMMAIGIAGSDSGYKDWIDNNARLVIPKGIMIPTQFNIIKIKIFGILNKYKAEFKRYPKSIILVGNSLGGAVVTAAYTQVFADFYHLGIDIMGVTHNGAPIRLEYVENVLNKTLKNISGEKLEDIMNKYYGNIMNIVNEDDILNNITIKLKEVIKTLGQVGKYSVIEGNDIFENEDLNRYLYEHIDVEPIRNFKQSKKQDIDFYSNKMIDNAFNVFKKSINGIDFVSYQDIIGKVEGTLVGGLVINGSSDGVELTKTVAKGIIDNKEAPLGNISKNIIKWYENSDKEKLGETTKVAIEEGIKKGDLPTGAKLAHDILEKKTAGNASLKRTAPIPIAYKKLDDVIELSGLQSNLTHFDKKAKEACQLYSYLLFELLNGTKKNKALENIFSKHLYYGEYKDRGVLKKIDNPSYAPESLLATITIFYHSKSFEEGFTILNKIDNGNEFANILGSLLGLYYGSRSIPPSLIAKVKLEDIVEMMQISYKLLKVRRSGK